ncbi:MAG: methyltransferase domain-containing protein [Nanoarchaeota archaeon]
MIKKILLWRDKKFYWKEKDLHTSYGLFKEKDLEDAKPGSTVKSNTDYELKILPATFLDKIEKLKKGPQSIPLKDIGTIITYSGLTKDSTVVDAGTGSGILACLLTNFAKQVTTYEIREDFVKIANKNIEALNLKNIEVKNKNITTGIDEKDVDLITLDMGSPWEAIPEVEKALKPGAILVSYSPSTPQVTDLITALDPKKFKVLKVIEVIEREWEFNERRIHPKYQMLGHSGFLVFVRKI